MKKPGATDKLVWKDLVRFDLGYWWVVGLCVAFYSTIFPFRTFANLYFIEAKGLSPEDAGNLKSILPLLSMIGMPLFGLLVDKIGKRAPLMGPGAAPLAPPFFLLAFSSAAPMKKAWSHPAWMTISTSLPRPFRSASSSRAASGEKKPSFSA